MAVTIILAFVPAIGAAGSSAGRDGALTRGQRAAMTWIRDHTPETTKVVILATDRWGSDIVSEWFPALSGRVSLTTSQGFEWVSRVQRAQVAAEDELRSCQADASGQAGEPSQADCVDAWVRGRVGNDEAVLFLDGTIEQGGASVGCCGGLAVALQASGRYEALWQGPEGTVLKPVAIGT